MSLNFAERIVNRNCAARRGTASRRREYIERDAQILRNQADFTTGRITRFELLERLMQHHVSTMLQTCW